MATEEAGPRCVASDPDFTILCGSPAVATATQGGRVFPVCQVDAERAATAGYLVESLPAAEERTTEWTKE